MGIPDYPREKWLTDLGKFIKEQMQTNEQIIVMEDFNEDVGSKRMKEWTKNNNLTEAVTERVGRSPTTRNSRSKAIDGVFVSSMINVIRAGYSKFGLCKTDHRALWIDMKESNVLGFKAPDFIKCAARRLQCGIPSIKRK